LSSLWFLVIKSVWMALSIRMAMNLREKVAIPHKLGQMRHKITRRFLNNAFH
jgi:hypothetical protein